MRLASMLVLCMLPGCLPGGGAASTAHKDDACTVAVRFTQTWLREWGNRPVVFSDAGDGGSLIPTDGWESRTDGWQTRPGEAGETPPPSMLGDNAALSGDSALARCPTLRAYLERARIPYGAGATKAAQERRDRNGLFSVEILSLSLPKVGVDGSVALVEVGRFPAPDLGGAEMLLLRRQPDGSWRAVSGRATRVT
jgi:hypothetical protein